MLKKLFLKLVPAPYKLRRYTAIRLFGRWTDESRLWQLDRHAVSRAAAIGIYAAMVPLPGQIFIAIALAILFRANLPLSVALIFITNPLTMPPIFYGAYKLGTVLIGYEPLVVKFETSWTWFTQNLDDIWLPLFIGSQLIGFVIGLASYFIVSTIWKNTINKQ